MNPSPPPVDHRGPRKSLRINVSGTAPAGRELLPHPVVEQPVADQPAPVRVSVLIVVRDQRDHLVPLLRTLHSAQTPSGPDLHLTIVDDASTDTTRAVDAQVGGDVTIIRHGAPRGLITGLREAAQLATAEQVLVLCPTDAPTGPWLRELRSVRATGDALRWTGSGVVSLPDLPATEPGWREGPVLTTRTALLAALTTQPPVTAPPSTPKVMLVPNAYPPSSHGGVETYVTLLAAELAAQGLAPLVLHPYRDLSVPDYDEQLTVVDGVDVLRVNRPENLWHQEFGDQRFEQLFADAIREHRIDVVHFHHLCDGLSPSLIEVARNAGARTVVTLHDGYVSCAKGHAVDASGKPCSGAESVGKCVACLGGGPQAPGPVRLQLTQRAEVRNRVMADALGNADLVTAPSAYIADLTGRAPWAADLPVEVRPLGLDLESFRGARTPARRRVPGERLKVVVMGNVRVHPSGTDTKGGLLVATAAQALPAVEVHVHGGLDDTFRGIFDQVPAVTVHGPYEASRRAEILAGADVLLIASPVESFCFVAREALALGVPVVTSDGGALTEAVTDGVDGLTFRAGDVDDLVRVLGRLEADEDLRLRLAAAAPRLVSIGEDVHAWRRTYDVLTTRPALATAGAPRLVVVVAAPEGGPAVETTLAALQAQDCGPGAFETVVVDAPRGGSPRAWAEAVARTSADLVLLLDEGDVPDRGLVSAHLDGHARDDSPTSAVVGWVALDVDQLNDPASRVAVATSPSLLTGSSYAADAPVRELGAVLRLGSIPRDLLLRALDAGVPQDAPELAVRLRSAGLRPRFHPEARRTVTGVVADPGVEGAACRRTATSRGDEVLAADLDVDDLDQRWADVQRALPDARAHAEQLRSFPLAHLRASSATLPDGRTVPASDVLLGALATLAEHERLRGALDVATAVPRVPVSTR